MAKRLVPAGEAEWNYAVDTAPGAKFSNEAIILECN